MIGAGTDGRERISMTRSLMIGAASFAITAMTIATVGLQGFSHFG
jgi:hypothetical protein